MTELDDELVPAIKELVDELGGVRDVDTLVTVYDPSTGIGAETPTTFPNIKLAGVREVSDTYIAQGLGKTGDTQGILAALDLPFTPNKGDRYTWDGVEWTTIRVGTIETGELVGAYKIYLRRA